MDKLILNGTDGFPLYTDTLAEAQGAWNVFNAFCGMAGDKVIISGCIITGNNVSDGFVVINGEVLPFKGGTLGTSIIIREEITEREFKDKSRKPVFMKRTASFGSSTPEKTYQWADFKRFDNLIENAEKNLDFEKRLKALETKKSPIPIGLIAIWEKPATEPIPEGWQEYTGLRGRFPLGWNPNDEEFRELGKPGGEKTHTLTIDEMPKHAHPYIDTYKMGNQGQRGPGGTNGLYNSTYNSTTSETGGNQPHNNMPPYRIIRFIEFVGFN